jgi:DEAD/DEAH box helicase domain-containing protein
MGYWLIFGEAMTEQLYEAGVLLRPNDYGPNWRQQREKALERDGYRCRMCGARRGMSGWGGIACAS